MILNSCASDRATVLADVHAYLTSLAGAIRAWTTTNRGEIDLEKFQILKALTRAPADYGDAKAQPHVLVALRVKQLYNMVYKQGDVVPYVICEVSVCAHSTHLPAGQHDQFGHAARLPRA